MVRSQQKRRKHRILKPILPSSRVAPIRTTRIIQKLVKRVNVMIKNTFKDIERSSALSSIRVSNTVSNAEDSQNLAHETLSASALAILLSDIKTSLERNIDASSIKMALQEAYKRAYIHEAVSVDNQISGLFEEFGLSLDFDPSDSSDLNDIIDVILGTLIDENVTKVRRGITSAVRDKKAVPIIVALLHDTEETVQKSFKRFCIDESNTAARQAKLEFNRDFNEKVDHVNSVIDRNTPNTDKPDVISSSLLWISALLPVTREWHASRHGSLYTAEEVQDFYSKDGNARNCYCSQSTVVTINGEYPYPDIIESMKKKHSQWKREMSGDD